MSDPTRDPTRDSTSKRAPGVRLHALGGEMAPPQIMADLRVVLELPARAKEHFWEALGPCLRDPLPPEMEAHLTRFCEAFGVPDADLGNAIRACRFLLREASLRDLSRGAFADDVARLSAGAAGAAGAEELSGLLLAGFEAAKKVVRGEVLAATLADHGKLVESIEWRTDMVSSSSRGDKIQIPVVWLTLGYREGERRDRISLQLTPEAVQSLKRVCERLGSS